MRLGRSEALDLLRTWRTDRILLLCEFHFADFAASFTARVSDVSESRLALLSDDKSSEMVLTLRPDFEFGYGDMRGAPLEAALFERGLVIFFPYDGDPETADRIVLAEVR